MDRQYPIYTVETECQDCYKCVRECPVKAIKVEHGHATVVPGMCVACGHCVEVCPAHAKKVRDDLGRARLLVERGRTVVASLAPSWVAEFRGITTPKMIGALKALGFAAVSETALGAQQVSSAVAGMLAPAAGGLLLSTACPSAVEYVQKYLPDKAACLTPLLSPMLAHARMIRREMGQDIAVVFIGPCIAKKREADRHPELVDVVLTFDDLRRWLRRQQVDPAAIEPTEHDRFEPETSREGAIYPIEGGMLKTIAAYPGLEHAELATSTGLDDMHRQLDRLDPDELDRPVFMECLACKGGCVAGPCTSRTDAGLLGRIEVVGRTRFDEAPQVQSMTSDELVERFDPDVVDAARPDHATVAEALRRIGKTRPEDELNCSGCGYETCRAFARALIRGNAEPSMCVSYLRKQTERKANELLRCMPSGVVIVDRELTVVECNEPFARMFAPEAFEVKPGLEGARLEKMVPFAELFGAALETGREVRRDMLRCGDKLYKLAVFTIEPHETVGAVIQDVTRTELKREQIARRAREVIRKNLSTVQEVACRLGEHMADTEILLRSIADDYAEDPTDTPAGDGGGT